MPVTHAVLEVAPDGGLTGTTIHGGVRRLASARTPIAEGERLASGVDVVANAAAVVMGFGVGHHVAALARRMKSRGLIIVFEPDTALLRAVFEHTDMTAWLRGGNVVIVTNADDVGALASATQGVEAVLASGVTILDHPPSRARLGAQRDVFAATFAQVMKAVRTNVVTTLVQMDVTVRNLLQNAAAYARWPGVKELEGTAKERTAVVVSAGPSLRRNMDLLTRPDVRERVIVIAVQTVLKQLLAKGIKPDYVTALDYHEISARFYEGLTRDAVEGVTLVVEPKCNPAILAAWPGQVRCVGDDTLDGILGQDFARDMGRLPPGATVAHLAYYFARYLGCDPVVLIGQDLGFTDGHYYGPGAAIHNVWAGELNEFNTLEMLEWQRIARMRNLLRKVEDVHGRAIYTDEQMSTYLVQFERDFGRDAERGLTTIDATEGGVRKRHTTVMTLAEALGVSREETHGRGAEIAEEESWARRASSSIVSHSTNSVPSIHSTPSDPSPSLRSLRLCGEPLIGRTGEVESRLQELRRSTMRVAALSREAGVALKEMLVSQRDQRRVNDLIGTTSELGREAAASPAYWLVQHINQTGQLNRYKADRAMEVEGVGGLERQRREIERDIRNVEWLADAADLTGGMIDDALASLRTGVPVTRDSSPTAAGTRTKRRVWACVMVDHERGGMGVPRDLGVHIAAGLNALQLTLARLARCTRLDGVVLLCTDVDEARRIAGDMPRGVRIEFERWTPNEAARRRVATGRAWARHCWRGGIANLSVYDEVLDPAALSGVMASRELDAAVVLGGDWACVDPALINAVIERHEERPEAHPITFTQAAPGLAGCLVTRGVVDEMARVGGVLAAPGATVGGLLGYQVIAPQGDPIAKPVCVSVPVGVRDAMVRCILDTPRHAQRLIEALKPLGERVVAASAAEIARALVDAGLNANGPAEAITFRVSPHSPRGLTGLRLRDAIHAGDAPAVTLEGDGCDVLDVPQITELAATARAYGASAVHLRTRLARPGAAARRVLALSDAVSVDLLAEDAATYEMVTGERGFDVAKKEWVTLVEASELRKHSPPPIPLHPGGGAWIIPRIERRDETLEQIEPFYTRWLLACGASVIDARGDVPPGARVEPLPLPAMARRRLAWSRRVIESSGTAGDVKGYEAGDAPREAESVHPVGVATS